METVLHLLTEFLRFFLVSTAELNDPHLVQSNVARGSRAIEGSQPAHHAPLKVASVNAHAQSAAQNGQENSNLVHKENGM